MSTTTTATAPAESTRRAFTPDVKKFTGFLALDGSTHTSSKAAMEHSREIKVKAKLLELTTERFNQAANGAEVAGITGLGLHNDAGFDHIADAPDLADFLYANRDEILAALNIPVTMRKPRTPKPKAASTAPAA